MKLSAFFPKKKPDEKDISQPDARSAERGAPAGIELRPGRFWPPGALATRSGVNFAISSHCATACTLLLYHLGQQEPYAELPLPDDYRTGDTWAVLVRGLVPGTFEYAYRMDGPYDPQKGLLFDPQNILLDPYAKAITGKEQWGVGCGMRYHALLPFAAFDWQGVKSPGYDIADLVIYELHTRFYTAHPSSGVEQPGTFAGVMEKIPYLKELGVNAVELMPVFQFDETGNRRMVDGKELLECWGYGTVGFLAPNAAYAAPEPAHEGRELKTLIRELHRNGIEVILDVVYNHTAEGDANGPCNSMKGVDNTTYYMLGPGGEYRNFSGCGNTLNCNHPVVQQLILESLRWWASEYKVDGFRFDLAAIFSRGEDGEPLPLPPIVRAIACDPVLSKVKLIGEVWDAGGLYQVGSFPASRRWAEWNGRYRDSVRAFLKGAAWESSEATQSITGSLDMYQKENGAYLGYRSSINLITCHDGFTLYDLYSYNEKHNLANGWNNTDGENNNHSWNCGEEGPASSPEVEELRRKMVRNACTVLLCSRGAAMILAGDEFGNSQQGNNNCYCQDNELSQLNWDDLQRNRDIFDLFRFMIGYRMRHRALRQRLPAGPSGFYDARAYGANVPAGDQPLNTPAVMVIFAGMDGDKEDIVLLAVNVHWEMGRVCLPDQVLWERTVDTAAPDGRRFFAEGEGPDAVGWQDISPRSVQVYTGRAKPQQ